MVRCRSCSSETPEGGRFCPACGAALDLSSAPTELEERGAVGPGGELRPLIEDARFVPGAVIDKRYRIIGLLGRGGMGEVYRADDLKLGLPVALKFLPREVGGSPERRSRFINEVRTARQVTHSNVCRVYDIDEVDGLHYLSMEYVDGEDLASLLRRIGRLPKDKAMQIARQLCAGVQAAHEQGILHRDLKPANVMIDGRGQVKITDFGLAGLEDTFRGREIRSGTPAYMSPEQLAGREVTVRSDLYSLGLVLYEMFTGKRAFEAASASELMRLQQDSRPTTPSSHVEGLDPAVEKAILRCLESRPEERPASAMALATTLPGGGALAAALAAGETPSPQMVADAGDVGGLHPAAALTMLALTLAGLVAIARVQEEVTFLGRIAPERSTEVLAAGAREILEVAGHDENPVDTVVGYATDAEYERHKEESRITEDVSAVEPSPLHFWLRQSPQHLVATPNINNFPVTWSDPPLGIPGEARVKLDARGRLVVFQTVPPSWVEEDETSPPHDWSSLFARAGLAMESFRSSEPRWNPPQAADHRAAWEGAYPDSPDRPVRVESGSHRGRPVYFRVFPSWVDTQPAVRVASEARVWQSILILVVLVGAGLLARRNLRLGRGDRRGAFRLTLGLFIALMLVWALMANHVPDVHEIWLVLMPAVGIALWWSLFLGYVLWIAVEPHVRRLWPELLISWGRLLDGRHRDPMVGRDLLVGALAGVAFWLLQSATYWATDSLVPIVPMGLDLIGARFAMSVAINNVYWSVIGPLVYMTLLLLFRILFRKRWLAAIAWVAFMALRFGMTEPGFVPKLAAVASAALFLIVLVRFGLLASCALSLFGLSDYSLTLDMSRWYAGQSLVMMLILAAGAVYAFYISLAGRSALGERFFEVGAPSRS